MQRVSKASGQIGINGLALFLISRMVLFACFQGLLALLLHSWVESQKFWVLNATLTNLISIGTLVLLFRHEGTSYLGLFRFDHDTRKRDLVLFPGLAILTVIAIMVPDYILTKWLAFFVPAVFLSLQHTTLPLVFDFKFMIFRGLPFFRWPY